jgi:hypothetical protein
MALKQVILMHVPIYSHHILDGPSHKHILLLAYPFSLQIYCEICCGEEVKLLHDVLGPVFFRFIEEWSGQETERFARFSPCA